MCSLMRKSWKHLILELSAAPHQSRQRLYLELEDVREDILHLDPVGEVHGGVRPDPVHERPQLEEEGDPHEEAEGVQVHVVVLLAQEVA